MRPMTDTGSTTRVAPGVTLHDNDLHWSFSRSGGPGGQHANKTSTKATLVVHLDDLAAQMPRWAIDRLKDLAGQKLATDPDRIQLSCGESRSQHANREACLARLRDLLVRAAHRPRRRKKTRPSRAARERRIQAKKERGQRKSQRSRDWSRRT